MLLEINRVAHNNLLSSLKAMHFAQYFPIAEAGKYLWIFSCFSFSIKPITLQYNCLVFASKFSQAIFTHTCLLMLFQAHLPSQVLIQKTPYLNILIQPTPLNSASLLLVSPTATQVQLQSHVPCSSLLPSSTDNSCKHFLVGFLVLSFDFSFFLKVCKIIKTRWIFLGWQKTTNKKEERRMKYIFFLIAKC